MADNTPVAIRENDLPRLKVAPRPKAYEHSKEQERASREIKRVVRPEGQRVERIAEKKDEETRLKAEIRQDVQSWIPMAAAQM
jgi:hypothetical protein